MGREMRGLIRIFSLHADFSPCRSGCLSASGTGDSPRDTSPAVAKQGSLPLAHRAGDSTGDCPCTIDTRRFAGDAGWLSEGRRSGVKGWPLGVVVIIGRLSVDSMPLSTSVRFRSSGAMPASRSAFFDDRLGVPLSCEGRNLMPENK